MISDCSWHWSVVTRPTSRVRSWPPGQQDCLRASGQAYTHSGLHSASGNQQASTQRRARPSAYIRPWYENMTSSVEPGIT